ncbi:hypothetical protein GYMLUDRAFT_63719 [Collybiopsis luxurians FD-317 M1]|uniref:Uncharacterized protein n=1 Tax=Collybiopsis luxurians FD-317 M1 TaxID=944289 RepID=A0A0D0C636_9AGAR|nr:hypothetical protein GYMLUDRAFT_63719 [Collybiopsis luxurians FD-317 M1]
MSPDEMFEFLIEDQDGMGAGSVVQRNAVTWFHQDMPEENEQKDMMQDSHGGLGHTEGLAKNVLFWFRDVTIYLQLHVQDCASDHVLMGKLFDVLTRSTIKACAIGDAEVTITDPNSGRYVMLTYPQGLIASRMPINTLRYNDWPNLKLLDYLDQASDKESNANF